jgi:prepilin-type N-terminal cleavage/methylation domain-containing protein
MNYQKRNKGFTLIESMMATVIIAIAIVALMASNLAYTSANTYGADLSTAEFLIEEIRELTAVMDYDGLASLDDKTYSPPIDMNGGSLADFANFSQIVAVENVNENNFTVVVGDDASDFLRVTVSVTQKDEQISSASWIRAKY